MRPRRSRVTFSLDASNSPELIVKRARAPKRRADEEANDDTTERAKLSKHQTGLDESSETQPDLTEDAEGTKNSDVGDETDKPSEFRSTMPVPDPISSVLSIDDQAQTHESITPPIVDPDNDDKSYSAGHTDDPILDTDFGLDANEETDILPFPGPSAAGITERTELTYSERLSSDKGGDVNATKVISRVAEAMRADRGQRAEPLVGKSIKGFTKQIPPSIPIQEFPEHLSENLGKPMDLYTQILIWCLDRRIARLNDKITKSETPSSTALQTIEVLRRLEMQLLDGTVVPDAENSDPRKPKMPPAPRKANPINTRKHTDLKLFHDLESHLERENHQWMNLLKSSEQKMAGDTSVLFPDLNQKSTSIPLEETTSIESRVSSGVTDIIEKINIADHRNVVAQSTVDKLKEIPVKMESPYGLGILKLMSHLNSA